MRKIIIAFAILLTIGLHLSPAPTQAQQKFEFQAKSYIDYEQGRWWFYTECSDLEGDSCTTKDVVVRQDITYIFETLRETFFLIVF